MLVKDNSTELYTFKKNISEDLRFSQNLPIYKIEGGLRKLLSKETKMFKIYINDIDQGFQEFANQHLAREFAEDWATELWIKGKIKDPGDFLFILNICELANDKKK